MLKIAVCDDEIMFTEWLCEKIKKIMPKGEVCPFYSGMELLKSAECFDVYFLDIQMERMNGIETAKKLREREETAMLVFITAAKEYVFEAFDVAAMQYLLKPVEDKKLAAVLARAERELQKRQKEEARRIFVKTREKNITLKLSEILYFENQMRKIIAHGEKETISFYGTMADMEQQAGDAFFRCHRGYLVNMAHIVEYEKDTIRLTNGEQIYLSRERYADFVKRFMRYLRDGGVFYE